MSEQAPEEEPTMEELEEVADWLLNQPPGSIETEDLEEHE